MAKQSFQLDPNAVVYTDDEIVGKVNAAAAAITRADAIDGSALGACDLDDVAEGATNKHLTDTKDTKLTGIEEDATADQDGAEVRDLIVGLGDTERKLVITDPQAGEFKVIAIQRDTDSKLDVDYDDVAE